MSVKPFGHIRWAQSQTGITNPVHANTLVAIAIDCNADGVCYPSQARIATAARYSIRAVRKAIAWLEEQGYLRREERRRPNGSRTSDRIILLVNRQDDRQEVPSAAPATGISEQRKRHPKTDLPEPGSRPATLEGPVEEPLEESSEPSGSGASTLTPQALLFSEGRPALLALGVGQREAGTMIGRWLRDTGDDATRVLSAIRRARDAAPHTPIPWITANLKATADRPRTPTPPRQSTHGGLSLVAQMIGLPHDPADLLSVLGLETDRETDCSNTDD